MTDVQIALVSSTVGALISIASTLTAQYVNSRLSLRNRVTAGNYSRLQKAYTGLVSARATLEVHFWELIHAAIRRALLTSQWNAAGQPHPHPLYEEYRLSWKRVRACERRNTNSIIQLQQAVAELLTASPGDVELLRKVSIAIVFGDIFESLINPLLGKTCAEIDAATPEITAAATAALREQLTGPLGLVENHIRQVLDTIPASWRRLS